MQEDTFRTAFTFGPILRHRTADRTRRITAISFDTAAGRIFLGLASGHVEEYQIFVKQAHVDAVWPGSAHSNPNQLAPGNLASTRLVAEKRISRQPISSLFCLPTAARLAILSEDGTAVIAAYDTWSVTPLQGVRTAIAMAADPGPAASAAVIYRQPSDVNTNSNANASPLTTGKPVPPAVSPSVGPSPRPVRLAVAVKSITTVAKLLVYSIAPAIGFAAGQPPAQLLAQIPLTEAVTDLIWVGSGLFVQHPTSYNLLQPGGRVTQIAEHGCRQPRMASAPWPSGPSAAGPLTDGSPVGGSPAAAAAARGALLFQDSLLVLTDGNGTAVVGSEPIPVSESPLGIASSGPYMVLVSDADGGLLVYDRGSSRLVQRIDWAHDDPWVAAARRIPVSEDASGGGGVVVATSSVVMLLQPVAPDMQARELLKRKRFDAALALIRSCRRAGEQWADTALAQAGLLLLQELRCDDALTALEEVGPATFPPAQLLALFPRWCRRWLPHLPMRQYWGLHGSLQSLHRLCEDFLELRRSTSSSPRPSTTPPPSTTQATATTTTALSMVQLLPPTQPPPQPPQLPTPNRHMHLDSTLLPPVAHSVGPQGGTLSSGQQPIGGRSAAVLSPNPHAHHHHHYHYQQQQQYNSYQHHNQHNHNYLALSTHRGSVSGGLETATAHAGSGALSMEGGSWIPVPGYGTGGSTEVAALALDAKRHITSYLLRTRGSPVVQCLDGIDFLVTQLLLDTGETSQLETFLGSRELGPTGAGDGPGAAAAAAVFGGLEVDCGGEGEKAPEPPAVVSPRDPALVAALENTGRVHALAVLRAARGQVAQALELWQRLSLGEAREAPGPSGAVAAAAALLPTSLAVAPVPAPAPHRSTAPTSSPLHSTGRQLDTTPPVAAAYSPDDSARWAAAGAAVAAASAACLMAQPGRTLPLLCLSKLPWLLGVAPQWALHVLRSRPLPVPDVISLLQSRSDGVRWQYLHHLVYDLSGTTAALGSAVQSASDVASGGVGRAAAAAEGGGRGGDGLPMSVTDGGGGGGGGGREGSRSCHMEGGDPLWHLEPSLHTELALELVECVASLLLQLPQLQHEGEQRDRANQLQQLPNSEHNAESRSGADGASGAVSPAPSGTTSGWLTSASVAAAAMVELPPALPPLSPPASGSKHPLHAHGSEGRVLPSMLSTTSRAASPAWAASAVQDVRAQTPVQGRAHQQKRWPLAGQYSAAHRSEQSPAVHRLCSPRRTGGGSSGAPCPSTADLAWLGTIGSLTPAAVVRHLKLAVRAAIAAAGRDPDAAAAADGGFSDSLSLLRALFRCEDGREIGSIDGLRAVLQHHLYCSTLYDAGIVLQAISSSPAAPLLAREAIQLYCRLGDHIPALALLALHMGDVEAAIGYCRVRCGQEGWLALLDLLLRPPGGEREPDYSAACRVLAAEGAAMAPLQVLAALSDDMPLHLAADTLSRMTGSVQHRKRHGQVLRALHRAQNLALRCELAQLQTARVVVNDGSICRGCQRPLSTRVFCWYPSGMVLCARCIRPDPPDPPAGQQPTDNQHRTAQPSQPLTRH